MMSKDNRVVIAIWEHNVALLLEGLESLREELIDNCKERNHEGGCAECAPKLYDIDKLVKGILDSSPEIAYTKD
jgi:hypothetical protein